MKFSDIPGHESVKTRLREMVDSDRLPHALLLQGPAGTGKMMLARALAQYLHCTSRTPDGDSCGSCPSCIQHQTFNSIDTHFSFPVLKNGISAVTSDDWIAEWRDFLTESPYMDFALWLSKLKNDNGQPRIFVSEADSLIHKLQFTTHHNNYKVVILWLPERMNPECANSLLKIIEEPYPDTRIIMVSDHPGEILPTIYSRLQRIDVKRLPDDLVTRWLLDSYDGLSEPDARSLARLADGSILRAASEAAMTKESQMFLDLFIRLMRLAYQRDIARLKAWSVEAAALGRETLRKFLAYSQRMVRENFIMNLHVDSLNYLNRAEWEFSTRFSPFITTDNVIRLINLLAGADTDIAGNANAKVVMLDVAVKSILLLKHK